jgi:hypothetical protein
MPSLRHRVYRWSMSTGRSFPSWTSPLRGTKLADDGHRPAGLSSRPGLPRPPAVLHPSQQRLTHGHVRAGRRARRHLDDELRQLHVGGRLAGPRVGARTVRLTCRRFPVMGSLPASTTSRPATSSNRLWPLLGPERTDEGDSVGNGVGTAKARSLPGGVLRACDLRRGWDLNPRRTNALTSLAGKRDRPDSATSPMLSERAYLLSRGAPPRRAPQWVRSVHAVPAVSARPRRCGLASTPGRRRGRRSCVDRGWPDLTCYGQGVWPVCGPGRRS